MLLGTRISMSAIRFPPSPICSYVTKITETGMGTGYLWVPFAPYLLVHRGKQPVCLLFVRCITNEFCPGNFLAHLNVAVHNSVVRLRGDRTVGSSKQ